MTLTDWTALIAIVLSLAALGISAYSFYFANWRKGKLVVTPPNAYAAHGNIQGKLIIQLPLAFYNDGSIPTIIRALRIILLDEEVPRPLDCQVFVDELAKDTGRKFATPFTIHGRQVTHQICMFMRSPGGLLFERKSYSLQLQALIKDRNEWRSLAEFPLHVNSDSLKSINQLFVAHGNFRDN